ncbi:tellurite resistance protein TerA [Frischella perrara]|uniref:Uncharacterized protein involved in stress response n=1 Tax=Frischella perrara TaxID=1267021 RepID=A0A0A7S4F5_FRIPE|nr:TerD family protein [Frischella perrara]AJA44176.1 Uncharacterized protein involved in stress response [Frischella perrara]PWV63862.1 tellurite resistance protein TerA [Frischella perrara]
MINLTLGANTIINHNDIIVKISSGLPVDASAFRLFANDKVKDDLDMVFYGQPNNENGSISWKQDHNKNHEFIVNLSKLANDVTKVAFTISCDEYQPISQLSNLSIQIIANNQVIAVGEVDITDRPEKALIMGEIYRRNSEWKFRFIAQGFNGGLKPLAENFGVNIVDEENSSETITNQVSNANQVNNSNPSSKVNLNKISLSKYKTMVSLDKQDNYGMIGINLNWNKSNKEQKGFLSSFLNINKKIDLDLAAFVRLKDKSIYVIQALGNTFGSLNSPCYVQLMEDDRNGSNKNDEWIYINGKYWKQIDEVLIYTFIYEGVPNWNQIDATVSVQVPGQPEIETQLTEGNNKNRLCAIVQLKNDKGAIKIQRLNKYFRGQRELAHAYRWNFRWQAGRK